MLSYSFTDLLNHWPTSLEEATAIQQELRTHICLQNDFDTIQLIAGVDVSYDIERNISHAVIVLMRLTELQPLHVVTEQLPTDFPYIPGFLSFREIPVILNALSQLPIVPDLLMVDGQGIAHPRRFGIAAHLGVLTNMPAIGVAKSRLIGSFKEPGQHKGDRSVLMHKQERIGTVLRSKDNTKPLFISPGHKVDHETAVEITLQCLTRYRLPEPTRIADKLSKTVKKQPIIHFVS